MTMTMIENLHSMLERGVDSALLRYSLGNEFLKLGNADAAISHLRQALQFDHEYSAAWKALGKALASSGNHAEAVDVLGHGIEVAERRGDIQAAKEMNVFRSRSLQALEGIGALDAHGAEVADVEHRRRLAARLVFGEGARRIRQGHVPAPEVDHLGVQGTVGGVER